MNTNTEINEILSQLKKQESSKRQRTSLYLEENLYKEFRLACGEVPPSKVIERLMRIIVEQKQQTA